MNSKEDWNKVWSNNGILHKIVDYGRGKYNNKFLSILKDYIKVNSFCELGCGGSSLLVKIARYSKRVVGIDYSKKALKKSIHLFNKKGIKNAKFIMDDCMNLKIKERFDSVWSQGLIEHFDDPAKIIQEHLKIAKSKGNIIISVPSKYSYMHLWYLLTRPMLFRKLWPWTDQIFFTKKSFANELNKYCNKIYSNYKINLYPLLGIVVLIIKKK